MPVMVRVEKFIKGDSIPERKSKEITTNTQQITKKRR